MRTKVITTSKIIFYFFQNIFSAFYLNILLTHFNGRSKRSVQFLQRLQNLTIASQKLVLSKENHF